MGDGQLNEGDKVAHGLPHQPYVLDKRKKHNKKMPKDQRKYGICHEEQRQDSNMHNRNRDKSAICTIGTEISQQYAQ